MDETDRVAETFVDRRILITGGTGLLGIILIEKILRCLPKTAQIYLLIRPKKNKDPQQRLEEMFNSAIFDTVKTQRRLPALIKTITIVSGDVFLPRLGLTPRDRKMLCENVEIVFHAAATVRFDEPLKNAVLINTRGTKLMIELAKEMKHLILFVHFSTAYSHPEEKILKEKTYPPPANPHEIIKYVEYKDDKIVESMTDKILGDIPNTYAFTKALSENLIEEAMPYIPAIILRPGIVIPAWKDPIPGWINNMNGPTGLLIATAKGLLRTIYGDENVYGDFIPIDIAVNGVLLSTWNFIYFKNYEKQVYHLTTSSEYKISWGKILKQYLKLTQQVPLNNVVWYPSNSMKRSRLVNNICFLLFHMIPAYLIDAILFLTGYRPIMCRVQRRLRKGCQMVECYLNNQWNFENTYIYDIRKKMNGTEYKKYQVHGKDMDIDVYVENSIRAARIYLLNEPPETLPAARRHLRIMYWVDVFVKILFFLLVIYVFWRKFSSTTCCESYLGL